MKPMNVLDAINDIDDEYIEKAAPDVNKNVIKRNRTPYYIGIAASIAIIIVTAVIGANLIDNYKFQDSESVAGIAEYCYLPEYSSLEEAEKAVGFTFNIPESYENSTNINYYALETYISADYLDKDEEVIMCLRKGNGERDISGDYNEYPVEEKIDFNGISVIIKGDESGYKLATWEKEGYSYSISLSNSIQLSALENLISSIS